MNIGALPRRCRPQLTRICTHGALYSRSAIPLRFNWSLTSSRQYRLPSSGLAKALDMDFENLKPLGYDFAKLRDCRIAVLLSCMHEKLYPGSATPRQLPRSSVCCVPTPTVPMLHPKLVRYDFAMIWDCRVVKPLRCAHGKFHLGSATPLRLPRSLSCCVPSLTARHARSI